MDWQIGAMEGPEASAEAGGGRLGGGGVYNVWQRLVRAEGGRACHALGPSWATASCAQVVQLIRTVR